MNYTESEILLALATKIENSTAIKAWCQTNYVKDHTLWIGVNQENPPPQTDYPSVFIFPEVFSKSDDSPFLSFSFSLVVAILNEDLLTVGQRRTFTGLMHVTEFRRLVENEVLQSRLGKVGISGETKNEMFFPLFASSIGLTITIPRGSRAAAGFIGG